MSWGKYYLWLSVYRPMGCGAVGVVKVEGCKGGGLWWGLRAVGNCVGTTARKPVQLKGSRIITGIYDIKEQRVHLTFFRPQIEPRFTLRQASPSHQILDPMNLNRRTFAHPVSIIPVSYAEPYRIIKVRYLRILVFSDVWSHFRPSSTSSIKLKTLWAHWNSHPPNHYTNYKSPTYLLLSLLI